jgi:hypothetical protein
LRRAREWPGRRDEAAVAEGDWVARHCARRWPGDHDAAAIGIVRLDAHGRIVERWDVMRILPEIATPPNGLFREPSVVRTSIAREMSHSTGIES